VLRGPRCGTPVRIHDVALARLPGHKESPANRTSATMRTGISEPMGGWGGWCRVFRRQISGTQPACPSPPGVAFFWRRRGVSPSSAAWGFGLTSRLRGAGC
jgi:hypothetical protein